MIDGIFVELRAVENTDQARAMVHEQYGVYHRLAVRFELTPLIIESRTGYVLASFSGDSVWDYFRLESGRHVWRVEPPAGETGRTRSATVYVDVLPAFGSASPDLNQEDLEFISAPAGEEITLSKKKRERIGSIVEIRHIPTDISVRASYSIEQWFNQTMALLALKAKVAAYERGQRTPSRTALRQAEKVRTIDLKKQLVTDHRTSRTASVPQFLSGDIQSLN